MNHKISNFRTNKRANNPSIREVSAGISDLIQLLVLLFVLGETWKQHTNEKKH